MIQKIEIYKKKISYYRRHGGRSIHTVVAYDAEGPIQQPERGGVNESR
jgi:hypothetical protein